MNYAMYHQAEQIVGGRFKLAAILQKRIVELMRGDTKLVDVQTDNLKEIAVREIIAGKIELICDDSDIGDYMPSSESGKESFSLFDY